VTVPAEVLAQRGHLAGAGDADELTIGQVGEVFAEVEARDRGGGVDGAVGLPQPGDELAQVGAVGDQRGRATILALLGALSR